VRIRRFRPRDTAEFLALLREEFPVEERVLGTDPEALVGLLRRTYRGDVRLLVGLLALVGRPLFDFFVAEEDGRLAGTTLVTYGPRAGYLSVVSVDRRFRRRGYARALLERAHRRIARTGRGFAALDVLEENAPARALYASVGYTPLREQVVLARAPDPTDPLRPPPLVEGLRAFRRSDGPALAALADGLAPGPVRDALPVTEESFRFPPLVAASTHATTAAWTLVAGGAPVGFVRATVGGLTRTAHLSQPIVAEEVDRDRVGPLVRTALQWIAQQRIVRCICEVPADRPGARAALEAAGFATAYRMTTLLLPLGR
jgi:ribosomal protein S18 acetylase RimI-like enzyme